MFDIGGGEGLLILMIVLSFVVIRMVNRRNLNNWQSGRDRDV